ncbi:conserved Plasmodium protein, unknown function [Plasmodium ovale]|uniref:Merozoite surface protein 10 n=2 Tax=Plasmodium ovale TaxID=36330 RepID=A0A1A8W6C9_PLAOA|nr:conserved Plasmodium protein, unknown function [Plasmodium ovale curtisi]SBS87231.1 conserved Plasmodium protein, unknown function [Plasmodium ovale curtisi]SCP04008.1 conserved Plasmodium protein, unknown function [Plasmodium ovale]
MSSLFFFVLAIPMLFDLSFQWVKRINGEIIKEVGIKFTYDVISRQLQIDSTGKEKCNKQKYYINEQCKIVNSMETLDENNVELCLNENSCSYISKYIFQNMGIDPFPEQDFKKIHHMNKLSAEMAECNNEVFLNEKIKCMCCKKEEKIAKRINEEEEMSNPDSTHSGIYYHFDECKCTLNYQVRRQMINKMEEKMESQMDGKMKGKPSRGANPDVCPEVNPPVNPDVAVAPNKCKDFSCTDSFCALQTSGEPFCSCFENYYFDKKVDRCIKHEPQIKECDYDLHKNKTNDFPQKHDRNEIQHSVDSDINNSQNGLALKGKEKPDLVYANECPEHKMRNEHGECEEEGRNKQRNRDWDMKTDGKKKMRKEKEAVENICLRLECFINSNNPECACINKNGEKIPNDIFDVSNISICTLNNINCDFGICNNLLNKNELGCICDKNFTYDDSLKTCISSSIIGFLSFTILLLSLAILASVL